jgi:acyl-CoA dehydrogenase
MKVDNLVLMVIPFDMHANLLEDAEQLRVTASRLVHDLLRHEPAFHVSNVVPPEVDEAFRELGFYGMRIPEEFGGAALGMVSTVAVVSELGRLPPQFWPFLRVALGASSKTIVNHGSDAQKQRWLPAIARGACGVAFALTEAGAGSDLSSIRLNAQRIGDEFILNGAKTYISNADKADLFVVFARTGAITDLKGALTAFLVEAGHPGMRIGPPMPTMGSTINGLFEVSFEDCRLPPQNLLGEEGLGFSYAMESLNDGRLNVGAMAIGMGRLALELAISHTKTRVAFGRPIAANQVVRHMLADAQIQLHAAWLMLLEAARRADVGENIAVESAMVKIFCSEVAGRVVDAAVQLFGAAGYSRGVPVERLYRDVRVLRIYEGASEVLRNFVAREILAD